MTTLDDRKVTPADIPARVRRSGCALKHTVDECDCYPPDSPAPRLVGCRECWGGSDYCRACGGWGETTRSGRWIHAHIAGSGATGPSTPHDDPWAASVTPWIDPDNADVPPF